MPTVPVYYRVICLSLISKTERLRSPFKI